MNSKTFAYVCREIRLTKYHTPLGTAAFGGSGSQLSQRNKIGLVVKMEWIFDSGRFLLGNLAPFKAGSKTLWKARLGGEDPAWMLAALIGGGRLSHS